MDKSRAGEQAAPGHRMTRSVAWRLTAIGLLAAGVTVTLYLVGRTRQPNYAFTEFGINPLPTKSLLATIALGLALLQVVLALWMYRKLPLVPAGARAVKRTHRVVGVTLFALTVPIALHCMIAYGVRLTNTRVAIHSIAGCFFYGAFTAKVLAVRSRRLPNWVVPLAGGTLAILMGVLWYSSAFWYYNGFQWPT